MLETIALKSSVCAVDEHCWGAVKILSAALTGDGDLSEGVPEGCVRACLSLRRGLLVCQA